jgi:hypothetical protein
VLNRRTRHRKGLDGAVEVQEDEPSRRPAQVVDTRDGLLAAVAALVQVDRRPDPAHLVWNCPVIGLEAEPRLVCRDAQRFIGPQAGRTPGRCSLGVLRELRSWHE